LFSVYLFIFLFFVFIFCLKISYADGKAPHNQNQIEFIDVERHRIRKRLTKLMRQAAPSPLFAYFI